MKKNIKKLLMVTVVSLVGWIPASKCCATVSQMEDVYFRGGALFKKRPHSIVGCPGQNTDEYKESKRLYESDPLTQEQFMVLRREFGSCGHKYVLSALKEIVSEKRLPRLKRIEQRKQYALWAYISRNWQSIFPEDCASKINPTPDPDPEPEPAQDLAPDLFLSFCDDDFALDAQDCYLTEDDWNTYFSLE